MNIWTGIGRLTGDPDIRESQSGIKIARYSLAIDRYGKGTDFVPCVAFDKRAEFAENYLHKGMKIAVSGQIETGSYENKEGRKVSTWDIRVDRQEFCEKKQEEPQEEAPDDFMVVPEGIDDEVPFV